MSYKILDMYRAFKILRLLLRSQSAGQGNWANSHMQVSQ